MYDLTTGEKRCRTSEVLAEEGDLILPNEVTGEISSEVSGAARRQIERERRARAIRGYGKTKIRRHREDRRDPQGLGV